MSGGKRRHRSVPSKTYDVYMSEDAVGVYRDLAREEGLFPAERTAIDRYFREAGASVLDVGCGTGRTARPLHERGFDVTGIDISETLVEAAREEFPEIDFRVADITDSDLPSRAFDYVLFSYCGLDCILPKERRMRALRELFRVLKPGGILVFSSYNGWNTLPSIVRGNWDYVKDMYFKRKNRSRLFSRTKIRGADEGDIEIYVSDPLEQWRQLRSSGFTLLDVLGQYEGLVRFFVRHPYYVAKR